MGMYTVLHMDVRLRDDVKRSAIDTLRRMLGEKPDPADEEPETPNDNPSHPLFQTERWRWMLVSTNAYASCSSKLSFHEYYGTRLHVTTSFKNYDDEISEFLDWLSPHVDPDMTHGTFVGYTRYEDHQHPSLIYCIKTPTGAAKLIHTLPILLQEDEKANP